MRVESNVQVWVNGKCIIDTANPTETLISFLRRHGYTGTKLGCAEGGCGSCTVMVSSYDYESQSIRHESVNACLAPICSLHNKHVITIEGLGSYKQMHRVQKAVAHEHGSQCGFCTPGIVMSLFTELKNNKNPTSHDIEDAFDGNLCRCTGYRPILDGAKKLLDSKCQGCNLSDFCDKNDDIEDVCKSRRDISEFPAQLLDLHVNLKGPEYYIFEKDSYKWSHPTSIEHVLDLMQQFPHSKIINGNTEVGIEVRFKNQNYTNFIYTADVAELKSINVLESGLEIGAAVTIASLQKTLTGLVQTKNPQQTRGFKAMLDNIKYFAGRQVRNVSAIAGNICTASPISDLNPVLIAVGAILTVQSKSSIRQIKMSDFFLGYRKTALKQYEILTKIFIPFTEPNEYICAYKQAKRRDDDIAIVNAGLKVKLRSNGSQFLVEDAKFSFGGMGPTSLIAKKSIEYIIGKTWNRSLVDEIAPILLEDLPLTATSPGGQVEFRKTLAQSFFFKFVLHVSNELGLGIDESELSSLHEIERGLSRGHQVKQESNSKGSVGKSIPHASATKQVTGEALYVDDIPKFHNELYGAILGSTVAHSKILSVDVSEALKAPGVVGYVDANDVLNQDGEHSRNMIGPVFHDEELFATKYVHFMGQMILMILANTEEQARAAVKLCKVQYEPLPAIFTMEEAIDKKSFFPIEKKLERGDFSERQDNAVDVPLSAAKHFVQGTVRMSAQEHFYLETQASLVVPGEDEELDVYASTQNPTETQLLISRTLGIKSNKVVVRVKRLGGGFGGKESRSMFLTCALAVAATKYKRPARCMLSREEDMAISGTRHPFLGDYKVGFTEEGRLVSLELDMYANAGFSYDLSIAVMERALTHCDNAYLIPHMRLTGRLCKTNTPSNTAFRGFGGPQGMMIAEQYMTHVAEYLKKPVEEVRMMNFYKMGQLTHYSMPIEHFYLDRCWNELMLSSEYKKQRQEVIEYNKQHKYRKRGLAIIPTKFGVAFNIRVLNQAAALVHVYLDGSVKIAHGGTEMGQGLHTKMLQVAADAFGIPIQDIYLSETRTDTCINSSATAASVSSDLNGMAVLNACEQIADRLKPIREANPKATWPQIVKMAYNERINLSANGFYKTPDLNYDWPTNSGRMFNYFTYGAACALVEIDTLTGDHVVLRADIQMDIGRPINPAIDIGQIEGAFTQGLGWCTIEEPLISPTSGFLLTRGPGLYKIPGFKDIPVDFRVTVMDGVSNTRAIHSSKAVGEPPLFLGASVYFAIKDAIQYAREDQGLEREFFRMDSPATSERIRLACIDSFVKRAKTPLKPGEKPWGVPS